MESQKIQAIHESHQSSYNLISQPRAMMEESEGDQSLMLLPEQSEEMMIMNSNGVVGHDDVNVNVIDVNDVIHENDDDRTDVSRVVMQERPIIARKNNNLHRPSVHRPIIPQSVSEQYYQEAYQEGLTLTATSQAAVLAHEWHRKWTLQEEDNHTLPHGDFYGKPCSANSEGNQRDAGAFPIHYAFFHRQGAQNPFLGGSNSNSPTRGITSLDTAAAEERLKRTLHSVSPLESSDDEDDDDCEEHAEVRALMFRHRHERLSGTPSDGSSLSDCLATLMEPIAKRPTLSYHHEKTWPSVKSSTTATMTPNQPFLLSNQQHTSTMMAFPPASKVEEEKVVVPILAPRGLRPSDVPPSPPTVVSMEAEEHAVIPMQIELGDSQSSNISSRSENLMITLLNRKQEHQQKPAPAAIVEEQQQLLVTTEQDKRTTVYSPSPEEPATQSSTLLQRDRSNRHYKKNHSPLSAVLLARDGVLETLAITNGDVDSEPFKKALTPLEDSFVARDLDTRLAPSVSMAEEALQDSIQGTWLSLSKPTYFGCLGKNDEGDPMYTLGRMAFDMFSPTNLVCSLQGNFNPVEIVDDKERRLMLERVPKSLREEVESGKTVLRTYHIVTAFMVEATMAAYPTAPNKDVHRPIRGLMTTFGYSIPDPKVPNRHSIWFTGGRIEPNNNLQDTTAWKRLFKLHPPSHSFGEKAKLLAIKLLMGATVPDKVQEDGSMEYAFTRPLGGHGVAYVDVIYLDETLVIVRGHRGTVMVFSRLSSSSRRYLC